MKGFFHCDDLDLEKHMRPCKMGDAWTILEDDVDDSYIITPEQERMIFAWDEFRRETNIKVIGFPLWLDSFGLGIDDDKTVFDAQGYNDMPKWKKRFLENNRKFYLEQLARDNMWDVWLECQTAESESGNS